MATVMGGGELHAAIRALSYRLKRGPDDLLTPLHTNGGGLLAAGLPGMTVDSDAKKAKLDASLALIPAGMVLPQAQQHLFSAVALANNQFLANQALISQPSSITGVPTMAASTSTASVNGQRPSKVVHLRNIPSDMTDMELVHFCMPYGKLVNYLMLKGKNQAFVEYEEEQGAQTLVAMSIACPVAIRDRTIFCQFSTHQELKTDKRIRSAGFLMNNSEKEADGEASNLLVLGNGGASGGAGAAGIGSSALDISACTQQQPNSVLRVIIENMLYPVTLDVLHQIFSRYGKVLRIITFNKNNTFQALVQLSEATSAQMARQALDGQNVYNGCCCLRIDYSKLATLNVKYNNDKSRDYTNPNLPSGELTLEQQLSLVSAATGGQMGPAIASLVQSPFAFPFSAANPQYALQQQTAFPQAGFADALAASPSGMSPFLTGLTTTLASGAGSPAATNAAVLNATAAALRFPHVGVLNISPVILVSNLDENKVTPDALFTLFGVYGDVQRVKILFNKKDNALIQYAEPQQAQLAIQHLDKVRWHDKQIRVATSKHSNVQMPKEGQPDAGLTRDYSQSPLHRFKKPGSKNYMNIYPPSATLHLSNIPPNITEEYLTGAFEQRGFTPKGFKFFPKDHKMALLQLNDIETAIEALIEMHNFKLAENAHLRVSFSKSGI